MELLVQYPVALILLATLSLVAVGTVIRRIWFHPLSSFQGPWLGKFTNLVTFLAVSKERRTFTQCELLQRYGSPLRIGTNHLVFSDLKSFTEIYGQSSNPCLKDGAVYDGLSATGAVNILNATNRDQHARLRRLISHSFTARSLLESEAMIQAKVEEYISILQGKDGQVVDILKKTYELYLDIVSQLSFGDSFDCLAGKNSTAHSDVQAFFTVVPAMSFAPFLRYLPIKRFQDGLKGLARLQEFSRAHVVDYLTQSADKSEHGSKGKFLHNLATAIDAETGTKLTREELVENAIIFLCAGSGTTAATTIYLIWECGRHGEVRRRLAEEIRAAFPDPNIMPSYDKASKLKFLNCVIEEVLRLRGPLNVGNPRISPGRFLGATWVPKGVAVESCLYAMARDPHVFEDPLRFNPSRWENATPEMKAMSRPFSYGPRNCVGRHLAEISLTLTMARLYQLYDVVPDLAMTTFSLEQIDKGVLEPDCDSFKVVPTQISYPELKF